MTILNSENFGALKLLTTAVAGGIFAFVLALALTPLVRHLARKYGYVAQPRVDRWHRQPTALFGGVAIFLAFVTPFSLLHGYDQGTAFLILAATVIFGLGIVDDLHRVQPYTKLVVQIGAASLATFGSFMPSADMPLIVIPLAIFGLVALTNAFNLLDNMDGLSAGTACIAAFFLFVISSATEHWMVAVGAAIIFGSTLGFLFYNFNPATIFMGDSGSMFLGFVLTAFTMKGNWEQATNLLLMVLTPLLVLAVPIFDTTFVTVVRWMNGRAISQGGRDHTSHRLVTFGLSERQAVLFFYLISVVCGFIAFLGVWYNALLLSLLGTLMVIGIAYLGMFLNGVVVYGTEGDVPGHASAERGVVLDIFLMHKRRILEVLVDVALICLAYTASFFVRFDGDIPEEHFVVLAQSLSLIIPLKLLAFSSFGLYRGVWRYVGMRDLLAILKAVTVSSLLVITAMTMLFRFELFPRTVFVIDWMILLLLAAGVRVLIRAIREYLFSISASNGKRVVIVGAGDAGEMVLREMRNNAKLGYVPVGFFDDDNYKQGRKIHGVSVLGGTDKILEMVGALKVDLIMIAIPSAHADSLTQIVKICKASGLPVSVVPSLADLINAGLPALCDEQWAPSFHVNQPAKEQTWH